MNKKRLRNKFFKSIQGNLQISWTGCMGYHRRIEFEDALQCVHELRYRGNDY